MRFACLCDGDFLDTEQFYNSTKTDLRGGWPSLDSIHTRFTAHLNSLEGGAAKTPVNSIRAEIRRAVAPASMLPASLLGSSPSLSRRVGARRLRAWPSPWNLVRDYGTTVVFSTATQPAFRRRPGRSVGLDGLREMAPNPDRLFERLKRVEVRWPADATTATTWEALADEVGRENDVLVIVHRRSDARTLTQLLDQRTGAQATIHLSALMCPAHRSQVLNRLKMQRHAGVATRVVATQLIEAGVDVDFPIVYRALGGMDSLAKAAGRCNREGKLTLLGQLRVFVAPSKPPWGVLTTALGITQKMLHGGVRPSIDSPSVFDSFFSTMYGVRDLDTKAIQGSRRDLDYRMVAENYRLIEDDWSAPIVVNWGRSADALSRLEHEFAHESR